MFDVCEETARDRGNEEMQYSSTFALQSVCIIHSSSQNLPSPVKCVTRKSLVPAFIIFSLLIEK